MLELSGLFVCLGDSLSFSVPEGTEKIAGCGLLGRGLSTRADNMPPTPGSSSKILYADVHKAQQTIDVKHWLHECNTSLNNVPGGTKRRVQPFNVNINSPFNNHACELFKQHLDENLELHV